MSEPVERAMCSRRTMLKSTVAAAGALSMGAGPGHAAAPPQRPAARATIRDRMWIFTVFAGGDNGSLESGGVRGGSRMTPAEGAFWLNVPNLLLIRSNNQPPLPEGAWRAKTSFEQWAISFQPLEQVVWSVVGSGGKGGMSELSPVLNLAKKYPNISGIYLDDFIIDCKKGPDGRNVGRPAVAPEELKAARQRLKSLGRPMDIWVTLYSHELIAEHRHYRGCEPPLASFLDQFDVLTLWTWNSDDLRDLDKSLAALEAIAPRGARKALGMYIWDFPNRRPVPLDLMQHQCELGLKWLKEKRVHELIFLANTVLDVGLPGAQFAREWIAKVGSQPV